MPIGRHRVLCDEIKRNLEHSAIFFKATVIVFVRQVGNITQSDASLVRNVDLRFTAPLAKHIFAGQL